MMRFISTDETLYIRNLMLREGKLELEECRFVGDDDEGSFHTGYYQDGQLVSIATFHPRPITDKSILDQYQIGTFRSAEEPADAAYQLRGMATLTDFQGRGFGNKLVNFAATYLKGQKASYIWCNARRKAFGFYRNLGFEFVSDEFEVAGIGPHKVMYLKIR